MIRFLHAADFHLDSPFRGLPGAKARLYAVPFVREAGKAPKFGEPVGLSLTDGTPFYAHTRTVVVPYDWNNDGATDIILSTENYANKYNVGIELFLNDGKKIITDPAKLAKAKVTAEIVEQFKGEKQLVFKFQKRKRYHRLKGHRQQLTRIKITKVQATSRAKKAAETEAESAE